ncbi:hypothetical protein SAMN05444162_0134 [Paenibacillaceae bacterium GAS479]|nr:hypothetical protein SAMN05444162_0134 [Paenibacillaceae bacterium GAS479]
MSIDLRTMPAGPELDMELAKAMGREIDHENWRRPMMVEDGDGIFPQPIPAYSTTWAGAGQVIEEMQRRGWDYILQSLDDGGHGVRFDKWNVTQNRFTATARAESDSAPHAITVAAILALRSEAEHGG